MFVWPKLKEGHHRFYGHHKYVCMATLALFVDAAHSLEDERQEVPRTHPQTCSCDRNNRNRRLGGLLCLRSR